LVATSLPLVQTPSATQLSMLQGNPATPQHHQSNQQQQAPHPRHHRSSS
jgi:hypothetical protein